MLHVTTMSGAALPCRLTPAETNTAGRLGKAIARIARDGGDGEGAVTCQQLVEEGFTPDQLAAFGPHGAAFAARRLAESAR